MGVKSDGIGRGFESLVAAKASLQIAMEKSRDLAAELEKTGPRLEKMSAQLPEFESVVGPLRNHKKVLTGIGDRIDRAIVPSVELLKFFDAVHVMEKNVLSDPKTDIGGYMTIVKSLEDANKFLMENRNEAAQLLEEIVDYMGKNNVGERNYLPGLKKTLENFRVLQENEGLDGGLLEAALDKLENEFQRLLEEQTVVLQRNNLDPCDQPCILPPPLAVMVVQKLQEILERLTVNERLGRCVEIYVCVRGHNARESLRGLGLGYLDCEFCSVQSVEGFVGQWGKDLEFAVKHLLDAEYRICGEVFEKIGADVWLGCFGQIAMQSGMLGFLKFGEKVVESKPDPIKLLRLLDVFDYLNKLRPDFNKLFGGKACFEIQNRTRDLVKKLIEGACEIFRELLTQVELQRQRPPPGDGGVPMLVSFLLHYCNQLLEDRYKPVLTLVLVIERSWRQEKFQERILKEGILNIIRALQQNLETWCECYEDPILKHLFLMNNHWHFFLGTKGTKLGELLGDPRLREHQDYKDYYKKQYLRESWLKIPALLSKEGLISFAGGRATARDLLKQRLKSFNGAFDDLYRKHARWVVPDKELREELCQNITQSLLPVYRSYMQSYGPLVQQEESSRKYAKYTPQDLEWMLGGLFQQKTQKPVNGAAKFNRTVSMDATNNPITSNGKPNLVRTSSAVT